MSSLMSRRECFKILGLPPDASPEAIRQAYRTKAKDCHPDKNPDDPEATARFQKISQAYQVLQKDFRDPTFEDDSAYSGGGFSFLDLLLIFQREMLLEEIRRREAMRRQAVFRNLFGGPFFSPRMRIFDDDDDDYDVYYDSSDSDDFSFCSDYIPRRERTPSPPWTSYTSRRPQQQSERAEARWSASEAKKTTDWSEACRGSSKADCGTSGQYQSFSYRSFKSQQEKHDERPENKEAVRDPPTDAGTKHPRPNEPGENTTSLTEEVIKDTEEAFSRAAAGEWDQCFKVPVKSHQDKSRRKPRKTKTASTYAVNVPMKMTKKQLLAQQNRRQKEANEIGKELRAKAEVNMKLKEQLKNSGKGKGSEA
ncbi:dnaJ homolog subfamily B member 6-like [Acanthaster planci]|uniref:DnaJ homolog subfamily B member 6-like n=1 Tax=Acanthaster planci TaxID=133434 RepID=A0A8B7Z3E2_ACAPL|nr:dnaJ homolog subfamily B member 6-like [Acanthaster planci]